LPVLLVNQLTD